MSKRFSRSERWLVAGAAALVAVALQIFVYDRWYSLLDEGYILALADEIVHGRVLYRDVYVDAPFPAAFYALAAWFALVGPSVLASRIVAVAIFAAVTAIIVRIAAELLPRLGTLVVAVLVLCYRIWAFPHWHVYSYSSLAVTALCGAALLVLTAGGRGARLVAAGSLAGLGILSKQDYGVTVTGSLAAGLMVRALALHRPARPGAAVHDLGRLALGAGLVLVPAFAALAAVGALPALLTQSVLVPLRGATSGVYPGLPPLLPLFEQDPVLRTGIGSYLPAILATLRWETIAAGATYRDTPLWDLGLKAAYYVPLVLWPLGALAWGRAAIGRRGVTGLRRLDRQLVLLAWTAGFLLAFKPPLDWVHLMMAYPPFLVLGPVLAFDATRRLRPAWRALLLAPVAAAVVALAVVSFGLGEDLRAGFDVPLPGDRGGVYTDARHGAIDEDVLRWIDEHVPAGEPVPVYPTQPMLGFLAGRQTAGGFWVVWPFQAADRDERIIADLERRGIDTLIYSLSQYAHLGSFRENAPQLYDYLVDHYAITHTFTRERWGPLLVALQRRPATVAPPIPARALVGADATDARVARWPFAETIAVPVGTADTPFRVSRRLSLPPGRVQLDFDYGLNPERWLTLPPGPFTFTVTIADAATFRGVLDPSGDLADRRWASGSLAFVHAGDAPVTLTLAVEGPAAFATDQDLAGFARLRLASDG